MQSLAIKGGALPSAHGKDPVSPSVGIGFKPVHYDAILKTKTGIDWLEVHPENYMSPGGPFMAHLEIMAERYPISLHAVGLSPGSPDPVDAVHLERLKALVDRFQPALVSDHLAWSRESDVFLPDLLPVPYTKEALNAVCDNVSHIQDVLGRQILIENPSSYLRPQGEEIDEVAFLIALAEQTGCGILFDVNNLYVSSENTGLDMAAYLAALSPEIIGEIHLAGHKRETSSGGDILIDDHGSKVRQAVWDLYSRAIERLGPVPTLIEWDTDIPELEVLVSEAAKARAIIEQSILERGNEHAA
ncbi:MAG: DUF692 domain-containing protein [Rhodospirillaceae bacterium]|jgi:uncharacterized protein|nr:DUF692 domain-containing protein [Rhodospirillaceae bacterium]MBT5373508.1 DUF692 domain-containing protein [Rhodospirillaceae bacterium]MBT5660287.1 DUF692 domain-containing protein [Rhodospirillaceae bacterium]MBT5751521.1 DUF692 domain-containing protein [Rhodospirillaceae bacterium]